MKYILVPNADTEEEATVSQYAPPISLGGFFYDYLRGKEGAVCGIRYYFTEPIAIADHPIYRRFVGDNRFNFDEKSQCVDILFGEIEVERYARGNLSSDGAQDFGGVEVIRCGNELGIEIDLDSALNQNEQVRGRSAD